MDTAQDKGESSLCEFIEDVEIIEDVENQELEKEESRYAVQTKNDYCLSAPKIGDQKKKKKRRRCLFITIGIIASFIAGGLIAFGITYYIMGKKNEHLEAVQNYCNNEGCGWTENYHCPWDIFSQSDNSADDDGSIGYKSCCVYRLHVDEGCGYSIVYNESAAHTGKHLISTDPNQIVIAHQNTELSADKNSISYCDYICEYSPRGKPWYDHKHACDAFFNNTKYGTCENFNAAKVTDEMVQATFDCCCEGGKKLDQCGSGKSKEIVALNQSMPNEKYSAQDLSQKEKELIHEINKFCNKYDIFFHLIYTGGYDKDHMFPFTHVIPNNFFWYIDEGVLGYPGRFGFQRGDLRRNVTELKPSESHSREKKNDVLIKSWQAGNMDNRIEVTHGIDEDIYWCNEEGGTKDVNNLKYPYSLLHSKYAKKQRMKKQFKNTDIQERDDLKNIKDKDGKKCFNDDTKKYLLYISSTSVVGEPCPTLLSHKAEETEFKNFEEGLQKVTEEYNVILRYHPNDSKKHLYKNLYPNLCIQPDVHWAELSELVDGVLIEPSGATFASMHNWYQKPTVLIFKKDGGKGAKPNYDSWEHKVLNKNHCPVNNENDNLLEKVQQAFEDFNDNNESGKNKIIKARSDYFEKLFKFNISDVKEHQYNEFYIIIDIMKKLEISAKHKDYEIEIEHLEKLYKKMNSTN